jgi:type IV pilus assembly protein PilZ
VAGQEPYEAIAVDLSFGGMNIIDSQIRRYGEQVIVEVLLPGQTKTVRLPSTVRWNNSAGFGVQFGLLGARETHVVTRLVSAAP